MCNDYMKGLKLWRVLGTHSLSWVPCLYRAVFSLFLRVFKPLEGSLIRNRRKSWMNLAPRSLFMQSKRKGGIYKWASTNWLYTVVDPLLWVPLDLYCLMYSALIPCQQIREKKTHGYTVASSVPMLAMYCTDSTVCELNSRVVNLLIEWVAESSALFAAVRIIIRLNAMPITFLFCTTPSRHPFSVLLSKTCLRLTIVPSI